MNRFCLISYIGILSLFSSTLLSQVIYSDGATISIKTDGIVYSNGGVTLNNTSDLINDGLLIATKSSVVAHPGDFEILSNSTVSGEGTYRIEQNWINDAQFIAQNSTVELFGNTEQFITSTNGTTTQFNNLTLSGNGINSDRKKTLQNVNSSVSSSGILNLTDRELNTDINTFTVENINLSAIQFSNDYLNEGFVSSRVGGFLVRKMAVTGDYIFPVGSSDGTRRYRAVIIDSKTSSAQSYAVRMNNFISDNEGYPVVQHEAEIDEVNSAYYHSIRRLEGSTDANLIIYYDPSTDKDWESIAHWSSSQQEWRNIKNAIQQDESNYSYIEKSGWHFPTDNDEYAFITTAYELIIPNVLTPNGDGLNDGFYVTTYGLSEYKIQIINRWGNLVYESEDPNGVWDGKTPSSQDCTEGVYFYTLNAKFKDKEIKEHGFITLIRK
ncbi:MAG: gliding motility-associated C-terminal domain-containing protein [Brumimicrobium sp.]|nr:gliding motility-associated C-terminal domain-containing protein [Brumimicrobium sp.]MCO5269793.1 gliding motility-associated C-terminal domain-containing protein [Brumimicrobium sp.]